MEKDFILEIYSLPQTVFTLKELSLLFPDISYLSLRKRAHYFARTGKLRSLTRGVYAKKEYNPYELANKLYSPSYISLETVLQKAGLAFQNYETIFVISYLSRKVTVDNRSINYRRITDNILLNKKGIEDQLTYSIATKERAFLDAVFLYKDYHFDNLGPLDWDLIHELVGIYESKRLRERVTKYYQYFKSTHAE